MNIILEMSVNGIICFQEISIVSFIVYQYINMMLALLANRSARKQIILGSISKF